MSEGLNLFDTNNQALFLKKINQNQQQLKKAALKDKCIVRIQSQIRRHLSNKKHLSPFIKESALKLQSIVSVKYNYQEPKFIKMMKNAFNKMPFILQNISFINQWNYPSQHSFITSFARAVTDSQKDLIHYLLSSPPPYKPLFIKIVTFILAISPTYPDLQEFILKFFQEVGQLHLHHQAQRVLVKPYNFNNLWALSLANQLGGTWKNVLVENLIKQELQSSTPFRNKVSFTEAIHQNGDITLKYLSQLSLIHSHPDFNSHLQSHLDQLEVETLYSQLQVSFGLVESLAEPKGIDEINMILSQHRLLLEAYTSQAINRIKQSIFKKKVVVETSENRDQIQESVRFSSQYSHLVSSLSHPVYSNQLFSIFQQMFSVDTPSSQENNFLMENVCSIYNRLIQLLELEQMRYLFSRSSINLISEYLSRKKIRFGFVDEGSYTSRVLNLYVSLLLRYFENMDNFQFTNPSLSFPLEFILSLIKSLLKLVIFIFNKKKHSRYIQDLFQHSVQLLSNIYNKNSNTQYFDAIVFTGMEQTSEVNYSVLTIATKHSEELPFMMLPFNARYQSFQNALDDYNYNPSMIQVEIRRGYQFSDAFAQLHNKDMASRLMIRFYMVSGGAKVVEQGIDGGGLTKEFLNRVLRSAFDPKNGLFIELESREMIPNPDYNKGLGEFYRFVGKLMAKAILNGSLVPLKVSNCFINLFLGKKNTIEDLRFIDKGLYQTMMKMKHSNEDVRALDLTFSFYQGGKLVLLKERGNQIEVTNENKLQFINLWADYKTNRLYSAQSLEFRKGFESLIPSDLFLRFSFSELNMIISGRSADFDLKDFKRNTIVDKFSPDDMTMIHFWLVVDEMTNRERLDLLKFTTSCQRPPIMGFKELSPKFKITKLGAEGQDVKEYFPKASTCVNTLYLPDYNDLELLRSKLLYAIKENTGFGFG